MSEDRRSVLEVLRYELNFLEQGGYLRKIEAGQSLSPFQESLSCLNFGEPLRPHACRECLLYDFVPPNARTEEIPCHHIPLDPAGHTIASFLNENKPLDLERALKIWLRRTIAEMDPHAVAKSKAS
jgi:hypothetical protein